ncbi:MAG: deoxyribodipyrimidine photo-lyase [Petrotogales bacterium]
MSFKERIKKLKSGKEYGKYILYWMQASQRVEENDALNFAIQQANLLGKPLIVFFGIYKDFPRANNRSFRFMFEGLQEVANRLEQINATFLCSVIFPPSGVKKLAKNASCVVFDKGYTKLQRNWRTDVLESINNSIYEVESDVVVPVEIASDKEEYSAATLRKKIRKQIPNFLKIGETERLKEEIVDSPEIDSVDLSDIDDLLSSLNLGNTVKPSKSFHGGTTIAKKTLSTFVRDKLPKYSELKNDPGRDFLSDMSPYLHFGQISPIHIVLKITTQDTEAIDDYIEELIVRRELSRNFTYYNDNYDSLEGLPDWCKKTLDDHDDDKREYLYEIEELENAQTNDEYWNVAQKELVITGKMHGYMRMYWGKKVIEWSKDPQTAYDNLILLNDKYEIDGRDPNGYTGVLWCFGKHDMPFKEREIFGKVRYMSNKGLKRKFDMDKYVDRVSKL